MSSHPNRINRPMTAAAIEAAPDAYQAGLIGDPRPHDPFLGHLVDMAYQAGLEDYARHEDRMAGVTE